MLYRKVFILYDKYRKKEEVETVKKLVAMLVILGLLFSGCGTFGSRQYQATYFTLFDTVTTVMGTEAKEADFQACSGQIHDALLVYHRLFDIYTDYAGLNNLKTVNDNAGIAPVQVDGRIIALLLDCKAYYSLTQGRVNVMMGSVLRLWHEARSNALDDPENARLPDAGKLRAAAQHTSIDALVIDEEASTVYISDPEAALDVGAVAKGWAAEQVAKNTKAGYLISLGGNVVATGPKDDAGTAWNIGVQDPDTGGNLLVFPLTRGCAVTSGDYQRAYRVDGKDYHHIIDPDTLYPGVLWRSVTIVCADSGLADALSTALFLLPLAEGQALLETCGAEAMWVACDNTQYFSPGFH